MTLQRDLADSKFSRRLFVEKSADYQGQHLEFAWREVKIPSSQHPQLSARRSRFPVLRNRRLDRDHQVGVAERFRQEIDCTALDRADRRRNVTMGIGRAHV